MNHLLALDALDIVKRSPTASYAWQWLNQNVSALAGPERAELCQLIAALPLQGKTEQWLRCSVLADLTGDAAWSARQAALADAETAPGAILGLLNLRWYFAIVGAGSAAAFYDAMAALEPARLQRLAAAGTPRRPGGPHRPAGPVRKVALCTPHLANRSHGGTLLTLNLTRALLRQGVEVHVFTAQEAAVPLAEAYSGSTKKFIYPSLVQESLVLEQPYDLVIAHTELSLGYRYAGLAAKIHEFAPDLVAFVGFMSPLAFALSADYPMLGMSVHASPPAVPLDVWLSPGPDAGPSLPPWPGLDLPAPAPFPYRFWPEGIAEPMPRSVVGIPDDAVLVLTCGFRLASDITPDWASRMFALLARHPAAHWLLVGLAEGETPAHLPAHPRIHRQPARTPLAPWLAMADIYACPPRVGGGGTVAMAMEQGVAVAAMAATDGGDKTGPYAAADLDHYCALLDAWIASPSERSAAGAALRRRFTEHCDLSTAAAGSALMDACAAAVEHYTKRQETRHD